MSFHTGSLFYVEKYESTDGHCHWAVHQNKDRSEHLQQANVFSEMEKKCASKNIDFGKMENYSVTGF